MTESLNHIAPGVRVQILEILNNELKPKLMEMGFLEGEDIVVEQIAPLGDPISVMVSGYQVSLRINEAESILVEEK